MNRIRPSRPSRPVTLPHLSAERAAGAARSARLRGRAALVGLAAALTVSATACEFGSSSERAVAVEASEPESPLPADAPAPTETPAGDAPVSDAPESDAPESDAAADGSPESDAPATDGTSEPAAIEGREHDGGADDRDHATGELPVGPGTEALEPVIVVVQPEPATPQPTVRPEPRPAAPVTPVTSAPVATVPPTIVPPTIVPPTTQPPTTEPPTQPPVTTMPPTTMPPTTQPPTTQPPTTQPPTTEPTPTRYVVEVGTVGVQANDCTKNPSDTATFIEGSGGAYGAPQFPIGTYVSTSSPTQIGEPSYTFVDAPGTRAVWGQITWKFTGITGDNVISFNVRNVGTTTVRDHRSVNRIDGGTCSPLISYTITVTPKFD